MQAFSPETGSSDDNGFLQSSANLLNIKLQKSFFAIIFIFLIAVGVGLWLGDSLIFNPGCQTGTSAFSNDIEENQVVTLLEVSDLSVKEPELLSIWFIHIHSGEKPRLGFTPVTSITMPDDPNFELLDQFSLDENKHPSQKLLQAINKLNVHPNGYFLIDQASLAAFVNWFAGKELTDPINVENHSMAEYGQILRGLCKLIPKISEKGISEFPWSKFASSHLSTSLQFDRVLENMNFLTSPSNPPQCEMVPLP